MHRVIHFELGAQDPARAVKFYQEVFGWQITKWEGPQPYWLVTTGSDSKPGINGGILRNPDGGARTVNTIAVPSVEEFIAKVTAQGGQVEVSKVKGEETKKISAAEWAKSAGVAAGTILGS